MLKNYLQIKTDVASIVQTELKRMPDTPGLSNLIIKKEKESDLELKLNGLPPRAFLSHFKVIIYSCFQQNTGATIGGLRRSC